MWTRLFSLSLSFDIKILHNRWYMLSISAHHQTREGESQRKILNISYVYSNEEEKWVFFSMCEYRQERTYCRHRRRCCCCCHMLIMMFVHNPLKKYEYTKQITISNVFLFLNVVFLLIGINSSSSSSSEYICKTLSY